MGRRRKYSQEVEELILNLRRQGYSYRQIAENVGCSVYKVYEVVSQYENPRSRIKQVIVLADRVNELAKKIEELAGKANEIEARINEIVARINELSKDTELPSKLDEIRKTLEEFNRDIYLIKRRARWKRNHCIYYGEDGYCYLWRFSKPIKGLDMKKDGEVYRINVKKHVMHCAACTHFQERTP